MVNFIAGILTGFLMFAVIVILVDRFMYADEDVNPIDIVGGVLFGIWHSIARLFNNVGKNAKRSGYISDATQMYVDDFEEELIEDVGDEDMAYIDNVVNFCKEGER